MRKAWMLGCLSIGCSNPTFRSVVGTGASTSATIGPAAEPCRSRCCSGVCPNGGYCQ